MIDGACMFLMEARVDFSAAQYAVPRLELRPLPVYCALPHRADDQINTGVGWIRGTAYFSDSYVITVSFAVVSSDTPEVVKTNPTRAFNLADPARASGVVYLCGDAVARPGLWGERFLSALRFDGCLDIAGINDSRGRTNVRGVRSTGKPTFVRVAARVDGTRTAILTRHEELGRVRRPYCLVDVAAPATTWSDLPEVTVAATRSALTGPGGLSHDVIATHLQVWSEQATRP